MIAIRVESSCFHTSQTGGEEEKGEGKGRGRKGDGQGNLSPLKFRSGYATACRLVCVWKSKIKLYLGWGCFRGLPLQEIIWPQLGRWVPLSRMPDVSPSPSECVWLVLCEKETTSPHVSQVNFTGIFRCLHHSSCRHYQIHSFPHNESL